MKRKKEKKRMKERKKKMNKNDKKQLEKNQKQLESNKQQIAKLQVELNKLDDQISKYDEETIKKEIFKLKNKSEFKKNTRLKLQNKYIDICNNTNMNYNKKKKKQEEIQKKLGKIESEIKKIEKKISLKNKKLSKIEDYCEKKKRLEELQEESRILEKKQTTLNRKEKLKKQKDDVKQEIIEIDKRIEISKTIEDKETKLLDISKTLKEKGINTIPTDEKYEKSSGTAKIKKEIEKYEELLKEPQNTKDEKEKYIIKNTQEIENIKANTTIKNKDEQIDFLRKANEILAKELIEANTEIQKYQTEILSRKTQLEQIEITKKEIQEYNQTKLEIDNLKKDPMYTDKTSKEQEKEKLERNEEIKNIDNKIKNVKDNLEITNEKERVLKEIQNVKQKQAILESKYFSDIDKKIQETSWQQSIDQEIHRKLTEKSGMLKENEQKKLDEIENNRDKLRNELDKLENEKRNIEQEMIKSQDYQDLDNELKQLNQRLHDIQHFQNQVQTTKNYKQQYKSTNSDEDLENYRNAKAEKQRQRDELIKKIHEEKSETPEVETPVEKPTEKPKGSSETPSSDPSSSTPSSDSKPAETLVEKPFEESRPAEEPKSGDTSKPEIRDEKPLEKPSIEPEPREEKPSTEPEPREEKPEGKPAEPKEEIINSFEGEKVDTSKDETIITIENPLGKEKPDIDNLHMSTHMEPESKIEETTTIDNTIKKGPSSSSGDDMNIDMYFNELGMEQNSPTNTASPVNNETLTQTDNFELNNSNTHTYTSTNEATFEQEKINIPETSTNIDPELQQLSSSIFNPTIEQKDKSSPVYSDESIIAPENIDESMFNMGTNQEKPVYDSSYMHTNNNRDSETINIFSDNLDNQSNYSNSYEPVPDIHNPVKENTPVFETQEEQQFESQPIEDITTTQSKNNLDLQTERNLDNDFDNYYQPDQNASTQTQSVESTNNTQNDYNLDQNSNSKTLVFETPIELSIDTEDNSSSLEGVKLDSNTQSFDSHLDIQSPEIKEEEITSSDQSYTSSTKSELDENVFENPGSYEKYEPEGINFELDKSNDSKIIQEETQGNINEEKIDTVIDNKPSNSKGDNMDIDLNDLIMEQDSSTNTMPSFDNGTQTRIDNTELETPTTSPLYDSTPETYVSPTPTKEETITFETQTEQPFESPSTKVEQPFESSYTSMEKSLDSSSTPIENPTKSPDNSMTESIFGPEKEPDPLFDSLENTRTEDKEQNKTPMDYTSDTLNKQEDEYIAPSTLNKALQYSMSNDSSYATIQQDFNQIKEILTDNTYNMQYEDIPIIDILEKEYEGIKDNTEKQKFAKKVADKLNEYYSVHEEEGNIDLFSFMNDLKESGFIHDSSTNTDSEDKK